MTRLQFAGPVQWLLEMQFQDKKMELQWTLIELMEEKGRKAKARANRALGKEKGKVTQKGKEKSVFSLEKANRMMEKANQFSGPQIRIHRTRVGPKANNLEKVMERVASLFPKERAKLPATIAVPQGILLETAR